MMGYSIRNNQFRYTVWMKDNYRSNQPFNPALIVGIEMYDYKKDPLETINVAKEKSYDAVSKELYGKMVAYFKSQEGK
jgi:hypothetical protein